MGGTGIERGLCRGDPIALDLVAGQSSTAGGQQDWTTPREGVELYAFPGGFCVPVRGGW